MQEVKRYIVTSVDALDELLKELDTMGVTWKTGANLTRNTVSKGNAVSLIHNEGYVYLILRDKNLLFGKLGTFTVL